MHLGAVVRWLAPGSAEREEGFRQEILRISHSGLRVAALVGLGSVLLIAPVRWAFTDLPAGIWLTEAAWLALICAAALGVTRVPALYPFARPVGWVMGLLFGCVLIVYTPDLGDAGLAERASLLLLVLVASLPLRPVQTAGLGVALVVAYLASGPLHPLVWLDSLQLLALSTLAAGLSAVLYAQRMQHYLAMLENIQAISELREAQTRMLLSEHAASLGKLAAAISHELNTPIGALLSGVDTLLLLNTRQTDPGGGDAARLERVQADLRDAIRASAERLKTLVARMQRFAHLDQAEVVDADLTELLRDAAALVEAERSAAGRLRLEAGPPLRLRCRPPQLSAVFHGLLANAVQAAGETGAVAVRTRHRPEWAEVIIEDTGAGLDARAARNVFDPQLQVRQGRVSAGNWSMFSARQIVREHGGEVHFDSRPGEGTRVTLRFRLAGPASPAAGAPE
jgi:signal transduction histidine kinase